MSLSLEYQTNRIPKISVIVPIYNVEKYLRDCIDSILKQTYTNLEIILVDDGSSDKCPKICDEYARVDSRIIVVHKKNGGLSDARNVGLNICTGDYISFIDSDDWVNNNMLETLMDSITNNSSDFSFCGISRMNEDDNSCIELIKYGIERKETKYAFFKDILVRNHENVSVCNKLYLASIFQDIRFPVGQLYEDAAIICKVMNKIKTVSYTGSVNYYYRCRNGSIMNSGNVKLHQKAIMHNIYNIKRYIFNNIPAYYKYYKCFVINEIAYIVELYNRAKLFNDSDYKKYKKWLIKNMYIYLVNPNGRMKNKIWLVLTAFSVFEPIQSCWRNLKSWSNKYFDRFI